MDEYENIQIKQKRTRTNPPRKWTVAEEKALIDFILEHPEIEKPTAQIYYRRFAETKIVPVDWKLARTKVRNMRVSYNRTKNWEGSTGAGSMEGETVKSSLLKMFSFFYEFEEIFGSRTIDAAAVQESLESDSNNLSNSENDDTMISESSTLDIEILPATNRKGIYSRTAVSDIMQIQSEMVMLKKRKLDQDLNIKQRELDIKEKEVAMKEKEIELKKAKINSREKLKILELEMKERLAVEELKLKYNISVFDTIAFVLFGNSLCL